MVSTGYRNRQIRFIKEANKIKGADKMKKKMLLHIVFTHSYVSPQKTYICWGMPDDSSQNQELTWKPGANIYQIAMRMRMRNKTWKQSQTLKNEILNNAFYWAKKNILESKRSLLELSALYGYLLLRAKEKYSQLCTLEIEQLPIHSSSMECLCKKIHWCDLIR